MQKRKGHVTKNKKQKKAEWKIKMHKKNRKRKTEREETIKSANKSRIEEQKQNIKKTEDKMQNNGLRYR